MESPGIACPLAPIALFTYKRPWHTRRTVESLQKNGLAKGSELYVFCDGPKSSDEQENIHAVRQYVRAIEGFGKVSIIHRDRNLGLAKSIISGVTEIVGLHGRIIVMEDDLVCSPNFLEYMNRALRVYENRNDVFSITGYNFLRNMPRGYREKVFLSHRPSSWGWGTWADRWRKADWEVTDFDTFIMNDEEQARFNRGGDDLTRMLVKQMSGEIDSWGIRWCYTHFRHDAYCLVPVSSKIANIGFDHTGTHCTATGKYAVPLDDCTTVTETPDDITINDDVVRAVAYFHRDTFMQRLKDRIAQCLQR